VFPRSLVPAFPRSRVPSFPRSLVPAFPRSRVPSFPRSLVPSFQVSEPALAPIRPALSRSCSTVARPARLCPLPFLRGVALSRLARLAFPVARFAFSSRFCSSGCARLSFGLGFTFPVARFAFSSRFYSSGCARPPFVSALSFRFCAPVFLALALSFRFRVPVFSPQLYLSGSARFAFSSWPCSFGFARFVFSSRPHPFRSGRPAFPVSLSSPWLGALRACPEQSVPLDGTVAQQVGRRLRSWQPVQKMDPKPK
jgi:hypothetical protein